MFNKIKTIYFIGIKGVGMTALAVLAKEKGLDVSGSDVEENFVTDPVLNKSGITVLPFNAENLKYKPDLVVVSAAYDKENIEIKEAKKKKLDIKPYSEALAMLAGDSKTIAVAGIHGKTTTAALISYILSRANLDPSFVIGAGEIPSLGRTGHYGSGEYIILEADEYRKSSEDIKSKFFDFSPNIEVITSIEMDHPDMFSSEEKIYDTFYKFACRIPRDGFIVLCIDYPKARKLKVSLADRNFETYGFMEGALWQIANYQETEDNTSFNLLHQNKLIGPFKLKIPGRGNVLNATASIIVALKMGIDERLIKKYLPAFSGVKRRFEIIDQIGNIKIIDDYAHHPRSIALTLEAIERKYPKAKILCIFQPHTYSRTKELLTDFSHAFKSADKIIITDIYSSAREREATVSGNDLATLIRQNKQSVKFIPQWSKIIQEIIDGSRDKETVIVTMGAGDIYKLARELSETLKHEE